MEKHVAFRSPYLQHLIVSFIMLVISVASHRKSFLQTENTLNRAARRAFGGVHRRYLATTSPPLTISTNQQWEKAGSEGMTLVIVESPAKARTIQGFLDEDRYIIDYCAGHVRDLSKAKDAPPELRKVIVQKELGLNAASLGVNVHNNFEPIYVNMEAKADVINRLQKTAKKCSRILLASDEDREGEAISWHLAEVLKPSVPFKRAVFSEITKDAIERSFNTPRDIKMDLVHSQETRRILDRLTGYTLSPVLWRFVAPKLSAGRVQSCGLHLISQREKKRWDFVESKYYSISGVFTTEEDVAAASTHFEASMSFVNGSRVAGQKDFDDSTGEVKASKTAKSQIVVLDNDKTMDVLSWLASSKSSAVSSTNIPKVTAGSQVMFRIAEVEARKLTKTPPLPFITSSLQQVGSTQLGLSPSMTMKIAQQLYENGFITYMRTDSPHLSTLATNAAEKIVEKTYGSEYVASSQPAVASGKRKATVPKNAQEAHEAIRPADSGGGKFNPPSNTGLEGVNLKLYELIYNRTLASVMVPSRSEITSYSIVAEDTQSSSDADRSAKFKTSDTVLLFDGFLAALGTATKTNSAFPKMCKGQQVWLSDQPPKSSSNVSRSSASSESEAENEEGTEDENEMEWEEGSKTLNPFSQFAPFGLGGRAHVTRPPSRYSQASFVKELEDVGVGRPSTYAKIFETLREREYVVNEGSTIIPTLKGLVVDKLLEKHFNELVYPKFTASMEEDLDAIANGEANKSDFLSKFYLGKDNNDKKDKSGLLFRVTEKLGNNDIDQNTSRSLIMPQLAGLGVLKLSRNGAYFSEGDEIENPSRWILPVSMQEDIRQITPEAINVLKSTETTMDGEYLGKHPVSGQDVTLRSGRFGKYLQVGDKDEKITKSIPSYIDLLGTHSMEDFLPFLHLPKILGKHPGVDNKNIILDVSFRAITLSVEGYPLKVRLPEDVQLGDVTHELALGYLNDTKSITNSQIDLGERDGELVQVLNGRFGYYIKCGSASCSLKKLNPEDVTLEKAIEMLIAWENSPRRKRTKSKATEKSKPKAKAKAKAKAKTDTKKVKRSPSSWIVFCKHHREVVKKDNPNATLGEITKILGAKWKELDDAEKAKFKVVESEKTKAEAKKHKSKKDQGNEKDKRSPSSWIVFCKHHREIIKKENPNATFGEITKILGAKWKELDDAEKAKFKVVDDQ